MSQRVEYLLKYSKISYKIGSTRTHKIRTKPLFMAQCSVLKNNEEMKVKKVNETKIIN